jgi:hypothetical protein
MVEAFDRRDVGGLRMARKQPEKKAMPVEVKPRPVRLDLPPEIHRLLRRVAADGDKSMANYVRDLVVEHVQTEAKRRGIK